MRRPAAYPTTCSLCPMIPAATPRFQWADGYTERYRLIYTDFRNQKRTIKDSGLWYGRVAASNRLNV